MIVRYAIPFVGLLALLFVTACGEASEGRPAAEQVRVEAFQFSQLPGGARIVTGKLHNPTPEPLTAQIQISLYDENNRRISSMSVLVRDVPPGASKSFREAVDDTDEVRGAKVRSVMVL